MSGADLTYVPERGHTMVTVTRSPPAPSPRSPHMRGRKLLKILMVGYALPEMPLSVGSNTLTLRYA